MKRPVEADFVRFSVSLDAGEGLRTDAAPRFVDDAEQRNVVVRVVDQLEVRDDVLDLLALVELHAREDGVRDAAEQEFVLERPRLGVLAVQDREVTVVVPFRPQSLDLAPDVPRLLLLVREPPVRDLVAARAGRPELLALAAAVVFDDRIGQAEDVPVGAVVLLQLDHTRVRKVVLELQDVPDVRAAPLVDALVVVPDDAQVARRESLKV